MSIDTYPRKKLFCNDKILITNLFIANTWYRRFIGLLTTKSLENSSGLMLSPCNSVHTIGMKFPIDLLFLNESFLLCKLVKDLPPNKLVAYCKNAKYVVEVPAGFITTHKLQLTHKLTLID